MTTTDPALSPNMRKVLRALLRAPDRTVEVSTVVEGRGLRGEVVAGLPDAPSAGLLVGQGLAEWVGEPVVRRWLLPTRIVCAVTHVVRLAPGAEDLARRLLGYRH